MASNLWLSAVRVGLLADRPTTPEIPAGTFGLYYATDTATVYGWTGSAWATLLSQLGGGTAAAASVRLTPVTFANLPAAPAVGEVAYITDGVAATIGSNAAGAGANHELVAYNGAHWIVGGVPAQA